MTFAISIPWIITAVVFFILGWYLGNNRGYKKGVKETHLSLDENVLDETQDE
jgi:hypothetical protein